MPDLDLNSADSERRLLGHPLVQEALLAISAHLETVETANFGLAEMMDDLRNGAHEAGVVWMNKIS